MSKIYKSDWDRMEAIIALYQVSEVFKSFFYGLVCLTPGQWVMYEVNPSCLSRN